VTIVDANLAVLDVVMRALITKGFSANDYSIMLLCSRPFDACIANIRFLIRNNIHIIVVSVFFIQISLNFCAFEHTK
jgi:hypothetical protein